MKGERTKKLSGWYCDDDLPVESSDCRFIDHVCSDSASTLSRPGQAEFRRAEAVIPKLPWIYNLPEYPLGIEKTSGE
jgi:hypothetical protein